jgi:uncharacterized protein YbaA (DUF1428 family)
LLAESPEQTSFSWSLVYVWDQYQDTVIPRLMSDPANEFFG